MKRRSISSCPIRAVRVPCFDSRRAPLGVYGGSEPPPTHSRTVRTPQRSPPLKLRAHNFASRGHYPVPLVMYSTALFSATVRVIVSRVSVREGCAAGLWEQSTPPEYDPIQLMLGLFASIHARCVSASSDLFLSVPAGWDCHQPRKCQHALNGL